MSLPARKTPQGTLQLRPSPFQASVTEDRIQHA
jgi:hypothetical protein